MLLAKSKMARQLVGLLETGNLLGRNAEKAKALAAKLAAWESTLPAPLWRKKAASQYHRNWSGNIRFTP